jgi:hypothetical protein
MTDLRVKSINNLKNLLGERLSSPIFALPIEKLEQD